MTPINPTTISEPDVRADGGRPAFTLTEILVVIVLILLLLGITVVALNKVLDSMSRSATVNVLNQLQTIAAEYETQTNGQAVNHLTSVTTPIDWDATSFKTDLSENGTFDPTQKYDKTTGLPSSSGLVPLNECGGIYAGIPGKYISPAPNQPPTNAAYRGYLNDLAGNLKQTSIKRFIAGAWDIPACREMIQSIDMKYARSSEGYGQPVAKLIAPCGSVAESCMPFVGGRKWCDPPANTVPAFHLYAPTMIVDGLLEVRDAWDTKIVYAAYVRYPEPGGDLDKADDFLPRRTTPFFVSAGPDRDFGNVGPGATAQEQRAALDNIYSYEAD